MKFNLIFILLIVFGLFGFFNLVSGEGCCGETNEGIICKSVEQTECKTGSEFADKAICESTIFCDKGCCFDGKGNFDKGVTKSVCESRGKNWDKDESCNVVGAETGCCKILGESEYNNKAYCENKAYLIGGGVFDFNEGVSEEKCVLDYTTSKENNACVLKGGDCKMVFETGCLNLGGEYHKGLLCTSKSLKTNCEITEETKCDEKRNAVYFVDSCGNLANIYDSKRTKDLDYWENVIEPKDSCGIEGSSNSATCGNCEITKSYCSSAIENKFNIEMGNFYCKDTTCEFKGEKYLNGESWCDFDGKIGDGDDVVGSRHWIYSCNQGIIDTKQECKDAREDVCVQREIEDGDLKFRKASCIPNDASSCLSYNPLNENLDSRESNFEKCKENEFCMIDRVEISEYFKFDFCVPKYPRGYNLKNEDEYLEAEKNCGGVSFTCPVVKQKKPFGGYKIVKNGECTNEIFTQKMNNLCRKVGDCGLEVNTIGDYTENYKIYGAPKIRENFILSLILLSKKVENQKVEFIDFFNPEQTIYSLGTSKQQWYQQYEDFEKITDRDFNSKNPFPLGSYVLGPLLGGTRTKFEPVTFTCLPWKPPKGEGNCDACNGDFWKPCSEYRCTSLGTHCTLVNKETESPICIYNNEGDTQVPSIRYGLPDEGEKYIENSEGFEILRTDGSCYDAGEDISLNIITDELATCRYSYDEAKTSYSEMEGGFSEIGLSFNHTTDISFGDLSFGESQGLDIKYENKVYVACSDFKNNPSIKPYIVDVCINEGKDISPPRLKKFLPESGSLVGFETMKRNISLFVNTFANCKWDLKDINYTLMNNEMECVDIGNEHVCNTGLPITEFENKYYFRCMDQPWLEEFGRGSERNVNEESKEYILKKPLEKIKIESINPEEDFDISTPRITKEIKVKTSGGSPNQKCYYSFNEGDRKNIMENTGKVGVHSQSGIEFDAGFNKIYVRCVDDTGDFFEKDVFFEIIQDTSVPTITRILQIAGNLEIITSEEAECRYSLNSCIFKWDEAKNIGKGITHSFRSNKGEKYFIKCKDKFENIPYGCSAVVKMV